jgi:hypothetical protein
MLFAQKEFQTSRSVSASVEMKQGLAEPGTDPSRNPKTRSIVFAANMSFNVFLRDSSVLRIFNPGFLELLL